MKLKGTVTIFLSVILIVVLAVVGGLLESARVSVAKEIVLDDAYLSMQNILAEYQRELWNDYHVFFIDGSFLKGDEEIKKKAGDYLGAMVSADEKSFLGAEAIFTDIGMNEAMIEGGCKYFMKQAIRYMKEAAPGELMNKAVGEVKNGEALHRGQEALRKVLQAKIKLEKKLLKAENKKLELQVKYSEINKQFADFKKLGEKRLKKGDIEKVKSAGLSLKEGLSRKKNEIELLKADYEKEQLDNKKEREEFEKELEGRKKDLRKEDYEGFKNNTASSLSSEKRGKRLEENEKKVSEIIELTEKENPDKREIKRAIEELNVGEEKEKGKRARKHLKKYEKTLEREENSEKKSGLFLNFLSGDSLKISTKKISNTRWKEFGEDGNEIEISLLDRGLFFLYLKKHFPHFLSGRKKIDVNPKKQALEYGLEYIVMGGNRDEENLRGVIQRIFAIRTGLWFSYYLSRPDKVSEATQIAVALVGALGPAAVAAVKTAILLGWATESAREDMREIIGGREVFLYPKTGPVKIGYEKYLDLFLMGAVKDWGERSVRLIEQNMKVRYLKEFRADNCFAGLVGNVKGLVPPKFFRLKFLKEFMDEELKLWEFDFQMSESLCR